MKGFKSLNLPYTYGLCETTSIEIVKQTISDPLFGGASVTIPLKVHI